MPETYYKAITPDGFDFHTGKVDYGTPAKARLKKDRTVTHPSPKANAVNANSYFSVATVPTDCTGMRWPARLLEVEAIGEAWTPHTSDLPNKRAVTGIRIIRELPAWQLFGAEGERILELIDKFDKRTPEQREALYAAYTADYDKFWRVESAVFDDGRADQAGLVAARDALCVLLVGWHGDYSSYCAALALLCRPLVGTVFTQQEYDILSTPWRSVMGEIHPDDKPVAK
ncbi:MAG TPA: hypothetical protein VGI56_12470 [Galbitalea sp.]